MRISLKEDSQKVGSLLLLVSIGISGGKSKPKIDCLQGYESTKTNIKIRDFMEPLKIQESLKL